MVNQGRLAKVMFFLMAAMTCGALVLLALQGEPIKPMGFSLASQAYLTRLDELLQTDNGIDKGRWQRVEICFRRSDAAQVSAEQGLTGDLALKFHFVLSDGTVGRDGQIFASHRWSRQLSCFPLSRPNAANAIRICLLGDPADPSRTAGQDRSLDLLVNGLVRRCRIESETLWVD